MPGTVLDTGEPTNKQTKQTKISIFMEPTFRGGETINKVCKSNMWYVGWKSLNYRRKIQGRGDLKAVRT